MIGNRSLSVFVMAILIAAILSSCGTARVPLAETADGEWWERLGDDELNALVGNVK